MNRKSDADTFFKTLAILEVTFDKELSDPAKKAYWTALEDLPIESIEAAAKRAMQTCKWFPKPAELRELVEGSTDDAAARAWEQLEHASRKAGVFMSVLFEDGAIAVAMERVFGSWVKFCEEMHPVYRAADVPYDERRAMIGERQNPDENGRMIQVGGLSPEMIRARQKEFSIAYRLAVREGAGSCYVKGHAEIDNQSKALPYDPTYTQGIYVQGRTVGRIVSARFDSAGRLASSIAALLQSKPLELRAPVVERKLLPESTDDLIDARAVLRDAPAIIARGKAMDKPKAEPIDYAERVRQLREQAAVIAEAYPVEDGFV